MKNVDVNFSSLVSHSKICSQFHFNKRKAEHGVQSCNSISFPLLSVKPKKGPPRLFRRLVQESSVKKCCFMEINGESDQDGHGKNLGYNSAVNRNETLPQSGMIQMTIILQNQRVKTQKVDKATGEKKEKLLCMVEYHYNMGLTEK